MTQNTILSSSVKYATQLCDNVKSKGIPIIGHEDPKRNVDAKVHIFVATAKGMGGLVRPTLDRLYPQESPGTNFRRG